MSTPPSHTFDEFLGHEATLLSIDIDRRDPGARDEVGLVVQRSDGRRARLVFTNCRELVAQLNFGSPDPELILDAKCLRDSPQLDGIRRDWAKFAVDFSSLRSFELETTSIGSKLSVAAPGFELRDPPDDSWFPPREPDEGATTASRAPGPSRERDGAIGEITSTIASTMKDRFLDFTWHDANLMLIEIDRRDPGHRDEVALVIEWPDDRRSRLVFTNCYLFEAQLNFGIDAGGEWIYGADCSPDNAEVARVREGLRHHGADITDLYCFEIDTSSTGGTIRIVARGFEVREPPGDSWFPPREPEDDVRR